MPKTDEASLANPGYNIAYNGHAGTTLFEPLGYVPKSITHWTYWHFPVYFYLTALWFKIAGFGLLQVRLLSLVFGLVGLVSWYVVASRLARSPAAGLLAMTLVATDFFFEFSASNGRMDMVCSGLGAAALAAYLFFRERSFLKAIFWAHLFATASILTHPSGMVYYLGLLFLILVLDLRSLSFRAILVAAVPVLVGLAFFSLYITRDLKGFFDQMSATLLINKNSFNDPGLSTNPILRSLQTELRHRYIEPFGFSPGAGAVQRLKILVLAAYVCAILGNLFWGLRNRQTGRYAIAVMTMVAVLFLALASPSKFSYYLAHVTALMATGLGMFLWYFRQRIEPRRNWLLIGAVVAVVGGIQLGGTLYQIRQDAYHRKYLPAIAVIRQNTTPRSIVIGPPELWFSMAADRYVVSDNNLGSLSRTVPDLFVTDGTYRALHEEARTKDLARFNYVERLLTSYREIYHDADYRIYRR